jgi:processive 1,2-diacylglycerol beta-glucosyltransferase
MGLKLLIVHGYEPSGHASVARVVETAARAKGLEAVRVNISSDYHAVLGPVVARFYLWLIRRAPWLWDFVYDHPVVASLAGRWQSLYLRFGSRRLEKRLGEIRPDVVVCTSAPPMAALLLARQRLGLKWPVAAIVTDYRAHRYWLKPEADLYFVASEEAAEGLRARGIPAHKVKDTGIPIDAAFAQPLERLEARRRLGLSLEGPVLLLSGGSRGLGRIREAAEALLARLPQAQILAACGANEDLRRDLEARLAEDPRVRLFPVIAPAHMHELMAAADFLIGKAGGVTVAEAMVAGLPIVIFEPNPGQEAGNAGYLLAHGAGLRAGKLKELGDVVEGLLTGETLAAMRKAAKALSKPDAAQEVLGKIVYFSCHMARKADNLRGPDS